MALINPATLSSKSSRSQHSFSSSFSNSDQSTMAKRTHTTELGSIACEELSELGAGKESWFDKLEWENRADNLPPYLPLSPETHQYRTFF
ncbi:hypothetical protein COP1_012648 [Malus domestica]